MGIKRRLSRTSSMQTQKDCMLTLRQLLLHEEHHMSVHCCQLEQRTTKCRNIPPSASDRLMMDMNVCFDLELPYRIRRRRAAAAPCCAARVVHHDRRLAECAGS